jgi:hypothetical protein
VLDATWRNGGRLEVFKRDSERNETPRYKPCHRRDNDDVRTTAEAAIARTTLIGIIGRVTRKNAGIGRNQLASKDLGRRHKKHQNRNNTPDCRPVHHSIL